MSKDFSIKEFKGFRINDFIGLGENFDCLVVSDM